MRDDPTPSAGLSDPAGQTGRLLGPGGGRGHGEIIIGDKSERSSSNVVMGNTCGGQVVTIAVQLPSTLTKNFLVPW
jgi:hypothetical protein